MTRATEPSTLTLWRKPALFAVVGSAVFGIAAYYNWWFPGALFLVASLAMAWWVSPSRKGAHTPWLEALQMRSADHAIIVWSPVDRGSSQLQIGLQPGDSRVTWVNYLHDTEAWAFAQQHGGYGALPIALVGDTVLTNALAGEVIDTLTGSRK